jgi:hypothetical protein
MGKKPKKSANAETADFFQAINNFWTRSKGRMAISLHALK